MKTLYKFKVKKPSTIEKASKDESGNEVVTKTVENKDVEIFIKKPSHREIDEMDLFYSIQLSELQAKGIATNTMILNSYQESGGLDSKREVEAMKKIIEELNLKRNKFLKESADNIKNIQLLEEIKELTVQVEDYQNRLSSVFDRSAESIAERRVVLWATLNLLFLKEGEDLIPIFPGRDYNQKLDNYYNLLDEKENLKDYVFEKVVADKGQVFIMTWLKKQAETEEDFKMLESILDESESDSVNDEES